MAGHMPQTLKDFRMRHAAALAWSGTAFTVASVLVIFLRFAPVAAMPLVALFILALAVAGLAALGMDLRRAFRDSSSAGAACAQASRSFAILAASAIFFLPYMLMTSIALIWVTLVVNCSGYALIVDEARRGALTPNPSGYQSAHGIRFLLASSQPTLIAFPIAEDMEGEWGAIVYDPTTPDSAAPATSRNRRRTTPGGIAAAFGRARCSPMITHYYRCTFA